MRLRIAFIFAVAFVMALPHVAGAAKAVDYAHGVPLVVNEGLPGFTLPATTLTVPRGVVKFTTIVPEDAKGRHGIGINGGVYGDINGADVAPGRYSSLTINLTPGEYTVFDSYKNNRAKGYSAKLRVTHARAKHVSYGTRCPAGPAFFFDSAMWVKNVTCSSARKLEDAVETRWEENKFAYTPIVEREFTCYISPTSAIGMKYACIADGARVTWTG